MKNLLIGLILLTSASSFAATDEVPMYISATGTAAAVTVGIGGAGGVTAGLAAYSFVIISPMTTTAQRKELGQLIKFDIEAYNINGELSLLLAEIIKTENEINPGLSTEDIISKLIEDVNLE